MAKIIAIRAAYIDGKYARKFNQTGVFMNSTWVAFNEYANRRGFTIPVLDGKYWGSLAWKNDQGQIMELKEEIK